MHTVPAGLILNEHICHLALCDRALPRLVLTSARIRGGAHIIEQYPHRTAHEIPHGINAVLRFCRLHERLFSISGLCHARMVDQK